MKICMLTSSYPKYPGETTAPFIEEIAAGLVRRGHTVHVVAPFHRDVRRAPVERGVNLHFFRYSPLPALNVWGYAESLKADVSLKGRVLAAAPLALGAGLAALLRETANGSPGGFDLVHAHWVLPNGPVAGLVARLRGLPLVISLHGSDVFLSEKAWPLALAAGATLRGAAAFTACSGDLRERALRLGAPADRSTVVPYGVDVQAFQPDPQAGALVRAELGLPPDAPLILALGRLVYKKGLTYLLEALPAVLERHPAARLVLAGYGDLRNELEQRAAELGLAGRVIFPGMLERERAARYISAADVYAVPSVRDQRGNVDGLPNTLLEGMAAARPIVASRIAGIPEVISDGQHGLLTPERDPAALATAITRLLDDPALAARLGTAARRRVLDELTWDATAMRFEQIYEQAIRHCNP
ncbi:MAG TPA: glycosyltransferase family 4 protein [Roseiflexaceae bacterium]|nr:glycosyltransferase family 4 protein [Roseiflexaceae bacterium]